MRPLRRLILRAWAYLNDEVPDTEGIYRQYQGDYRGSGCTSQRWFSACSGHSPSLQRQDCPRCMAGHYVTWWKHKVVNKLYKTSPRLWRWFANMKED